MFTHIVVGSDNPAEAKRFYDAALGPLGVPVGVEVAPDIYLYEGGGMKLIIRRPLDGKQASYGNGSTIGFTAPGVAAIDRFYAEGLKAGGQDAGAPGPRETLPGAYVAYLRDPTGNKIVAWCMVDQ